MFESKANIKFKVEKVEMVDVAKRDFIQNLKQLRHFFNNLKEVHQQHDQTLHELKQIEI